METKTAYIFKIENPKHWIPTTKTFKVVHVRIGDSIYEFSQLFTPTASSLPTDNTVIWKNYESQDPFNWDGMKIGNSDMSINEWLVENGFEVVWETPVDE